MPILACGLTVRRGVARDRGPGRLARLGHGRRAGGHERDAGGAWGWHGRIPWPSWRSPRSTAWRWCWPPSAGACRHCTRGAIACADAGLPDRLPRDLQRPAVVDSDAATMFRVLADARRSGTALVGLFVLFAAASELLARRGRRRHAVIYAGGAGVMALLGLMLTTTTACMDDRRRLAGGRALRRSTAPAAWQPPHGGGESN